MGLTRRSALAGLGGLATFGRTRAGLAQGVRRMPAEWEPHDYCVMAWTAAYGVFSRSVIKAMRREQGLIARAIARFEPVVMLVNPGDEAEAAEKCGPDVEIVTLEHYDLWTRDTLPSVISVEGQARGIDRNFNAWGGKFDDHYAADIDLAERIAAVFGLRTERADIVCEGGAIEVDGAGTLITTRSCLLDAGRNPGMTEAEIDAELKHRLGIEKVVWVDGSHADEITNGHIDGIAKFLAPGKLAVELTDDPDDPEYADLQTCYRQLEGLTDARGNAVEIIPIYRPDMSEVGPVSDEFAASSVNCYIANGGVVVPEFGDEARDAEARRIIGRGTGRPVETVRTIQINAGGGGIHCATQQVPAV